MSRTTLHVYLIDGLTAYKAEKLRKALLISIKVSDVSVKLNSGVVVVTSAGDPAPEVKMACSIAGCEFRMKVSKRKAAYYT
ncbi:MAG: hypothetical protein JEZ04_03740 [Spirochaetales bacterium]|nr:hypothetical protein [Spirochaetales bacterium]